MSSKVAEKLQEFLSESYGALIQAQNLHWNIEGDGFYSIHKLTEEMYDEQFAALDEIAERIRALGHKVNAGFDIFSKQSNIQNSPTMDAAIATQEHVVEEAKALIKLAEGEDDAATADLVTTRLYAHQKNIWMLKSQNK